MGGRSTLGIREAWSGSIDLISSNSDHELRYNLYLRMQIYYELLEEIFNIIYE